MSIADENQKSLEEILEEHLLNKNSLPVNRETFFDLLAQEVKGELNEASLSFESLMQLQKRITEAYHELMSKKSSQQE